MLSSLRSFSHGCVALFAASLAAGCGIPATAANVIENADQLEVMLLIPHAGMADAKEGQNFHGHMVTDRAVVSDPAARQRIIDIIERGVRTGFTQAKCFQPHHGVHAVRFGQTVDLVICYECSNIEIHEGGVERPMIATGNVQADLDAELAKIGVVTR
jgi:hypothetical protein